MMADLTREKAARVIGLVLACDEIGDGMETHEALS